jgi:hypothetical protein
MAKRLNTWVEIDGPLFDPNVSKRMKDALAKGIVGLAEEGAQITQDFVYSAGFVQSGRFAKGIGVEVTRRRGAGYATVKVVDEGAAYPSNNRPTRTLMDYGQRNGVRVRTGVYAFRKAKRRMDSMKYDGYFLPALMGALE